MKKIILFAITSVFYLSACSTVTQNDTANTFPTEDIKVDAREHTKYNYKGKNYLWTDSIAMVNDPEGKWVAPAFDVNALVASTIRKKLAKLGLNESTEAVDFVVAYGIGVDMAALHLKNYADSNIQGLLKVAEGTLVIVFADKKSKRVLWLASAEGEYKNLAADIAQKRIKYAIDEIFKRFPG